MNRLQCTAVHLFYVIIFMSAPLLWKTVMAFIFVKLFLLLAYAKKKWQLCLDQMSLLNFIAALEVWRIITENSPMRYTHVVYVYYNNSVATSFIAYSEITCNNLYCILHLFFIDSLALILNCLKQWLWCYSVNNWIENDINL